MGQMVHAKETGDLKLLVKSLAYAKTNLDYQDFTCNAHITDRCIASETSHRRHRLWVQLRTLKDIPNNILSTCVIDGESYKYARQGSEAYKAR